MSDGETEKRKVFISYSSKDVEWASGACTALETSGVSCWMAPRDILPGSEWGASIISGIDGASVMLLILSGNANGSAQVRREVERAISKGLVIVPYRVEDVPPTGALEYALSNTHWLDGFSLPEQERHQQLATAIQSNILGLAQSGFSKPARLPKGRSRRWLTVLGLSACAALSISALITLWHAKGSSPGVVNDHNVVQEGPSTRLTVQDVATSFKPYLYMLEMSDSGCSGILIANDRTRGLILTSSHLLCLPMERDHMLGRLKKRDIVFPTVRALAADPSQTKAEHVVVAAVHSELQLVLLLVDLRRESGTTISIGSLKNLTQAEAAVVLGVIKKEGMITSPGILVAERINEAGYLQASCPVRAGMAGGPVLLQRGGLLVGIVSGKDRQGLTLAVPVDGAVANLKDRLGEDWIWLPGTKEAALELADLVSIEK